MRIASGTTDQYIYFVAVDSTDFTTRETGLSSFTVYRSRNGGAASAMTTPTINETDATNMPGVYELLLDEDMTIDSGDDTQEMVFHITATGMAPVTRTIELYRPEVTAGETLTVSSGVGSANTTQIAGSAVNTSSAQLGVNVVNIEGSDATDQINAACDTAIETYGLDHLVSASVTGTDVADNSIVAKLVDDAATADWDNYDNTTASLEALNVDADAIKAETDKLDAAHTEPAGVPAANETPLDKLGYLYMALRNQLDVTSTKKTFYDDAGTAEWEKDLSDDGTTYSESKGNAI